MPKRDDRQLAAKTALFDLDILESGNADVWTDADLMQAVASSNPKAFSLLMGRHVPKMIALARRITLNASDADEVVQEAFLRVWTHAARWDVNGAALFSTWLHRIVTNLAIDRSRRKKPLPLEAAGDPIDPTQTADDYIQQSDEAQLVHQALAELPPRQRAAVALYYFDDMTAAQAATSLGLSVKATEALLVRAKRGLRYLLIDKKDKNHG